jgi:hypothetical protein
MIVIVVGMTATVTTAEATIMAIEAPESIDVGTVGIAMDGGIRLSPLALVRS